MDEHASRSAVEPSDLVSAPHGLPCAVHIGVSYGHVIPVLQKLRRCREVARVEGDGWFVWAEALGQSGNDHTTFHVVATTTNVVRTLRMIVSLGVPLVELGRRGYATVPGVVAVVTDPHDFEVNVAEVTEDWLALMTADWVRREGQRHAGGVARP